MPQCKQSSREQILHLSTFWSSQASSDCMMAIHTGQGRLLSWVPDSDVNLT